MNLRSSAVQPCYLLETEGDCREYDSVKICVSNNEGEIWSNLVVHIQFLIELLGEFVNMSAVGEVRVKMYAWQGKLQRFQRMTNKGSEMARNHSTMCLINTNARELMVPINIKMQTCTAEGEKDSPYPPPKGKIPLSLYFSVHQNAWPTFAWQCLV